MAKNISYDAVLTKNLSLPKLKVEQIEVVLDISGADPDPLTLQQIRDEPSLRDCFLARRKNINDLIESTYTQLEKTKVPKDAEALVNTFNKKLEGELNTLEKEMQNRADTFAQKQKRNVNDLFWAQSRVVVKVVWAVAKLIKGAIETGGKVVAAVASGGFLTVIAIKGMIGTVQDAVGAYSEFAGAREGEREQAKKLKAAVAELKKIKAKQPVPQSKIDAVSLALGPYGARLLGEDAAAKKLATKLDALLTDLEKGKFRHPDAQQQAEDTVHLLIKEIRDVSKNIDEGRKLLQSGKDKVTEAGKRAQKDPLSFWGLAAALWKPIDYLVDLSDSVLNSSGLTDAFEQCKKTLLDKLNEELQDATVEAVAS